MNNSTSLDDFRIVEFYDILYCHAGLGPKKCNIINVAPRRCSKFGSSAWQGFELSPFTGWFLQIDIQV